MCLLSPRPCKGGVHSRGRLPEGAGPRARNADAGPRTARGRGCTRQAGRTGLGGAGLGCGREGGGGAFDARAQPGDQGGRSLQLDEAGLRGLPANHL